MGDIGQGELAAALATAGAATVAAIYKYKGRKLDSEDKRLDSEDKKEDKEINVLLGHIAQLEKLWKYSLEQQKEMSQRLDAVERENADLKAKNSELEIKIAKLETAQTLCSECKKLKEAS